MTLKGLKVTLYKFKLNILYIILNLFMGSYQKDYDEEIKDK